MGCNTIFFSIKIPELIFISYHIKYMHIGDLKKDEIEKIIGSLHSPLKMRLRFLVHSSVSLTPTVESQPLSNVSVPSGAEEPMNST